MTSHEYTNIMFSPDDFAHLKIPLENILSVTNNFDEKSVIGTGAISNRYTGQLLWSGELIDITAERLNKDLEDREQRFWMEISMLSSLKHKNLVSLVGFCDENDEKIIITRREIKGSLSNHLSDSTGLTWVRRLEISVGLANVLSYIHYDELRDFSVIHRKITSSAVLLNDNWEPKLWDLERSIKIKASQRHHSFHTNEVANVRGYLDPTYKETKSVNHKSDIYSFGIVLLELLCGRESIIDNKNYNQLVPLAITLYREKKLINIIDRELLKQMDSHSFNMFAEIVYEWDISIAQMRELQEELGVTLPNDAFELLFVFLQECVTNDGKFIDNEFDDVYLATTLDPIPLEAFTLQESEVSAVKYISVEEYKHLLANKDPHYAPYNVDGPYGQLFDIITKRYQENAKSKSLLLQQKLARYAPISLTAELTGLSEEDKEVLALLIQAAKIMDDIFYKQVWYSNASLRGWLNGRGEISELDMLKWKYYSINKSPWSCLDENEAFLTTADSAVRLLPEATKQVAGWKGVEYKAAFPILKPPGASFYPPDMDKMEFEIWMKGLSENEKQEATGFFNVIKRQNDTHSNSTSDLSIVPYSQEYSAYLTKAAELLRKAGDLTSSPSLKRLLHSKADAFLSNDYYDSDIAWMELDSKLDVTIGPYETYEDVLFGYKATFEAFIGVRDDKATTQLKLFGDQLQVLEQNLPMDDMYKSKDVISAPIRVIQLVYNSGDVKGPQTVAFNLPNDERIVKDRGSSMVMLKNVSEAKFKLILRPIAELCIIKEQRELVDFDSFFTHTICHECCHGIGPHTITLPSGQSSTVRLELQELHSALEEAKADIVGLWALNFLIAKELLPKSLEKSMYVSFLAGCFRSVRFGLEEAHGKGQALQFNWLFEKGAFVLLPDQTFSVDFDKIEDAVESLSREILTIQAKGDKDAAQKLLEKYGQMTQPLTVALEKLTKVQVPVDIAPDFPIVSNLLHKK